MAAYIYTMIYLQKIENSLPPAEWCVQHYKEEYDVMDEHRRNGLLVTEFLIQTPTMSASNSGDYLSQSLGEHTTLIYTEEEVH